VEWPPKGAKNTKKEIFFFVSYVFFCGKTCGSCSWSSPLKAMDGANQITQVVDFHDFCRCFHSLSLSALVVWSHPVALSPTSETTRLWLSGKRGCALWVTF
jgi:hypothetical protein